MSVFLFDPKSALQRAYKTDGIKLEMTTEIQEEEITIQ